LIATTIFFAAIQQQLSNRGNTDDAKPTPLLECKN